MNLYLPFGDQKAILNGRGFLSRAHSLAGAQTAYFVGIMFGKAAILLCCKTRKLSMFRASWRYALSPTSLSLMYCS